MNCKTLRLSESFLAEPKENSLELVVNLINLNYNKDSEILQRSPSLLGYSKLLYHIQEELGANGGDLKQAIDTAVKACIDEGLIADFLHKHSKEVTGMLFKEITVEEVTDIMKTTMDLHDDSYAVVVRSLVHLEDTRCFEYSESVHRLDKFRFVEFARRRKV